MINQFGNSIYQSFFLYAQYKAWQQGQAYYTVTYPLYYIPDAKLPAQWIRYSSPFKGWIYDSGVSGALVTQYISGGNSIYDRSSGINIDYVNGGVIVPSGFGINMSLTGTFSVSQFSFYQPDVDEETLLTQGRFFKNPKYNGIPTGAIPPYTPATPCVFVNTLHFDTDAFQFGGTIESTVTFSLTVFAESNFQLSAMTSLYNDLKYQYLPMLNIPQWPLNGYGDTKSGLGGFNYLNYAKLYGNPGNLIYISEVRSSKVSDRAKINPEYFIGLIDLDLKYVRQTPNGTNIFT